MAYNPSSDFVGLWRAVAGGVEKAEIPGLDFWVAAMGRAGLINVVVSGIAPTANQDTTAWFQTATPSYAAEGALYLWDATLSTYVPATPALFYNFLLVSNGGSTGATTIIVVTGAPGSGDGVNGDFAIRLDAPGGIYGPKAAGAWPANPFPGTSYSQISAALDFISNVRGDILYRGAAGWAVLAPGAAGSILTSSGVGADPVYASLTAILDLIGGTQGDILYRNATVWTVLAPGALGQFLSTNGAAANPSWSSPIIVPPNRFVDTTPGTRNFLATVTGWHRITLNGAGGGAGGAAAGAMVVSGGAAGGGQVVDYVHLTSGVNYSYTIGTHGVGAGAGGTDGTAGGNTIFAGPAGNVIANGGPGGIGSNGGGVGVGGTGGSGFSAGGYALISGPGYQGTPQISQGGQGGVGAGFGAAGGAPSFGTGNPGTSPGGGGSGAVDAHLGGDGGNGQLVIEF